MKRKVIDDIVKTNSNPMTLYSNPKLKEMKVTETTRVSDKREAVVLKERNVPNEITLISNVVNTYNTIAKDSTDGILEISGRATITIPLPNLKLLKSIASCSINPNEEYSLALEEMFRYIMKQTINRAEASDDGVVTDSGTKLQIIVKKELMDFYLKVC